MEMRSGKRMRSSPTDTDGSRSPSPYRRSSSPSPSPYRSPSPSPCRSWSQRPPSYDDAYDDEDRSLSRSRGSDGNDAQGRAVWRPHSSRQSGERGHGGEFSVRIDDYDRLFTCRSCRRLLIPPVYQCPFSHVTCSRCHDEFGDNRCSSCGATNGYARNRAVEEFLWRISFSCRNKEYGCTTFLPQHEVRAHEQSCRHEPCFCPVDRCGFAGPTNAVEAHLTGFHHWRVIKFRYGESFIASAPKSTIYHSKDDDELFLIDSFGEGRGIAMSMICLRCDNAREQEFTYELKTPPGNVRGHHQLQLQSMVRRTSLRKGLGEKDKVFLLVPKELLCAMNDYVVEVCVRKEDTGA